MEGNTTDRKRARDYDHPQIAPDRILAKKQRSDISLATLDRHDFWRWSAPVDARLQHHRPHSAAQLPKHIDSGTLCSPLAAQPSPTQHVTHIAHVARHSRLPYEAQAQAGTQANPIALDDELALQSSANKITVSHQAVQSLPKSTFYAVGRGLIPGVYVASERREAKLCTHDWRGAKVRPFDSASDAENYVLSRQIDEHAQIAAVRDFFAARSYASRSEWIRRKELYQWFCSRAKATNLTWAPHISGPTDTPYIRAEELSSETPSARPHELSHHPEQHTSPPVPTPKPGNKPTRTLQDARQKASDMIKGHDRWSSGYGTDSQPTVLPQHVVLQNELGTAREPVQVRARSVTSPYFSGSHNTAGEEMSNGRTSVSSIPEGAMKEVKIEPELCPEQRNLVNLILSGRNVFYTGSAGCGKSTVLKAFVKQLREMGKDVRIVAPTGKAALEVNGSTYFTFAGWTPSHFKRPLKELKQGAHQTFVRKRMRNVDVLIIDEISMLENHIFERLNEVMKEARGSNDAFGGVQIVVTGDFCQLPPVKPFKHCLTCGREMTYRHFNTTYKCNMHGEFLEKDKWAFRSQAWQECNFAHVNLTQIHRQRDRAFIDILERCRMGKQLTPKEMDLLLNHKCSVKNPTRLYSTRAEVNKLNEAEYGKLRSKPRTFKCFDDAKIQQHHPNLVWKSNKGPDGNIQALQEGKFESRVDLKQGMRVVLQVNLSIDDGLVNGAQGVIVDWEPYDSSKLPKAEKREGRSARDKNAAADMTFQPNTIHGDHAAYREARVKEFVKDSKIKEWPIVEFDGGLRRTIYAECLVYECGDDPPFSIMSRTQVPLIAGWAMTVHKSQGMTLQKVEVDLAKSFEEGQVYVALSRATSLQGLKVKSLGPKTGGGNPEVHEFLRERFGLQV